MKFICTYCDTFVYDESADDESRSGLKRGTQLKDIPDTWRCPVCGQPKSYLKPISDKEFAEKKKNYDKLYPEE